MICTHFSGVDNFNMKLKCTHFNLGGDFLFFKTEEL